MKSDATKSFTVFTLLEDGVVKYVGSTQGPVTKALQNMERLSRCKTAQNYNTRVSVWLRTMYETFKVPQFAEIGTFGTRNEAQAKKQEVIQATPEILNRDLNRMKFVRYKQTDLNPLANQTGKL